MTLRMVDGSPTLESVVVVDEDGLMLAAITDIIRNAWRPIRVQGYERVDHALMAVTHVQPDWIFASYRMRDSDGMKFLEQTMARAPDARRVLMVATHERAISRLGMASGVLSGELDKPVTAAALHALRPRMRRAPASPRLHRFP